MEGTGLVLHVVRSQQSSLITKLNEKSVNIKFFCMSKSITKKGCKTQYLNIVPTKYTSDNGQCLIQQWYRK
jgi:hypothetical protein